MNFRLKDLFKREKEPVIDAPKKPVSWPTFKNRVAISPFTNDFALPGARQFTPEERKKRKKSNRQKKHHLKMTRGWA